MDPEALKTIRRKNSKWTMSKCKKHVQHVIDIISKKFPDGIKDDAYFTVPGFEHVTKNRPVISYNPIEGIYELTVNTQFKL
jgi:hypothetical protein